MPARRVFLVYWLPVLLWMAFIFWGSTDALSGTHTSRFIGPVLRRMFPGIADATVECVQIVVRKVAHGLEYGILVTLIWRARFRPVRADSRPWSKQEALASWSLAVGYALSDEWHQSFVASREGSIRDVAFDAVGAAVALWAIARFWWWRRSA